MYFPGCSGQCGPCRQNRAVQVRRIHIGAYPRLANPGPPEAAAHVAKPRVRKARARTVPPVRAGIAVPGATEREVRHGRDAPAPAPGTCLSRAGSGRCAWWVQFLRAITAVVSAGSETVRRTVNPARVTHWRHWAAEKPLACADCVIMTRLSSRDSGRDRSSSSIVS
ncbi:hypothetical protein SGLAM104S_09752 [Streptomyces glaucescens]